MKIYNLKPEECRNYYFLCLLCKPEKIDDVLNLIQLAKKEMDFIGFSSLKLTVRIREGEHLRPYEKTLFAFKSPEDRFLFKLRYDGNVNFKIIDSVFLIEDGLTITVYEK